MRTTYDRTAAVLAECLGVDAAAVVPGASLVTDLGADSLDLLDLTFQLEQEFGVRLGRGDLFPDWLFEREGDHVRSGALTEAGAARATAELPGVEVRAGDTAQGALTVLVLAAAVDGALAAQGVAA